MKTPLKLHWKFDFSCTTYTWLYLYLCHYRCKLSCPKYWKKLGHINPCKRIRDTEIWYLLHHTNSPKTVWLSKISVWCDDSGAWSHRLECVIMFNVSKYKYNFMVETDVSMLPFGQCWILNFHKNHVNVSPFCNNFSALCRKITTLKPDMWTHTSLWIISFSSWNINIFLLFYNGQ